MADCDIVEILRPWTHGAAVRMTPVVSDTMEPTLRSGDFVLAVPVSKGVGEGVYIFADGSIYRVLASRHRGPTLVSDNKRYSQHEVTGEWFDENVVAYVVAYLKVVDGRFLRAD